MATFATVKPEPAISPPVIVQDGRETGVPDIVQDVSPALKSPVDKLNPTTCPGDAGLTENASVGGGSTVKVSVSESADCTPVTVTVVGPVGAPAFTVKLAVTVPEETEQVGAGLALKTLATLEVIVHDVSLDEKPVPETLTDVPCGPKVGVMVMVCAATGIGI